MYLLICSLVHTVKLYLKPSNLNNNFGTGFVLSAVFVDMGFFMSVRRGAERRLCRCGPSVVAIVRQLLTSNLTLGDLHFHSFLCRILYSRGCQHYRFFYIFIISTVIIIVKPTRTASHSRRHTHTLSWGFTVVRLATKGIPAILNA